MNNSAVTNLFFGTSPQRILRFLCSHPDQSFYAAQIAKQTGLSKGGINPELKKLARQGYLLTEKRGRMIFYRVEMDSPVVRQVKVLGNVLQLDPLLKKMRPLAEKIILFGSSAEGTDRTDSDIDLFVISSKKSDVLSLIGQWKGPRKIQAVVHTPQDAMTAEDREPVFHQEVSKGIVLWEKP